MTAECMAKLRKGTAGSKWNAEDMYQNVNFEDIFQGFDMGNIFDMFGFGGGNRHRQQPGPQRGSDIYTEVQITLKEAYTGLEKEITVKQDKICPTCNGPLGLADVCSNMIFSSFSGS